MISHVSTSGFVEPIPVAFPPQGRQSSVEGNITCRGSKAGSVCSEMVGEPTPQPPTYGICNGKT